MAQETGTQILARSRIYAHDDDASGNYANSDVKALSMLNDVLVSLSNNVRVKPKWIAAATSGLTFAAGEASVVVTPTSLAPLTASTDTTTTLTSAGLFGSVIPGMYISGTGITPGTTVVSIASTSSLTMSVVGLNQGAQAITFTNDLVITEIESFHPSGSTALTYPIAPALQRVSVQEILQLLNYDGDTALAQSASEWTHVAAEKAQSDTATIGAIGVERWRVWAYPVINRTRHMVIRVPMPVTIPALGLYPDLDTVDSRIVSRLLAYEMAKLKKEVSQEFLNNILRGVPQDVLNVMYGGAVRASQLQSAILEVRD